MHSLPLQLTRSRFRAVYVGLCVLWVAASLGIYIVSTEVLRNKILSARAQYLTSLVRSQAKELEMNRDANLRQELVRSGVIDSETDYAKILPSVSPGAILGAIRNCEFLNPTTCVSEDRAIVLAGGTSEDPVSSSFAVILSTKKLGEMTVLWGWVFAGVSLIGLFALIIGIGIRSQEKFFLERIGLLSSAIENITRRFVPPGSSSAGKDEFDAITNSVGALAGVLQGKADSIERYKSWLTRHTRREQMDHTISHVAHDLRAPLEEGAGFARRLPTLVRSVSPEKLFEAALSMENRFNMGLEALDKALKSTASRADRSEVLYVEEIPGDLQSRFVSHSASKTFRFFSEVDPDLAGTTIVARPRQLLSVFWNLLENSYQAAPQATATLTMEREGAFLKATFSDTGPGIPPDLGDSIFSDFVTTKRDGTGLGLPSARRVVEDLGGSLDLAPQGNEGAAFVVRVPISDGKQGGPRV